MGGVVQGRGFPIVENFSDLPINVPGGTLAAVRTLSNQLFIFTSALNVNYWQPLNNQIVISATNGFPFIPAGILQLGVNLEINFGAVFAADSNAKILRAFLNGVLLETFTTSNAADTAIEGRIQAQVTATGAGGNLQGINSVASLALNSTINLPVTLEFFNNAIQQQIAYRSIRLIFPILEDVT